MLVTATAIPNTSVSAMRFPAVPTKAAGAEHGDEREPRGERQDGPNPAIRPTGRTASRCSSRRVSVPAANISSSSPS